MSITKEILRKQAEILNGCTKRSLGERYYVGYENGYANLFLEVGDSGRQTVSYGNTKTELSKQISVAISILSLEEHRNAE